MKNLRIAALAILASVMCTLTSCLNGSEDDIDYTTYDDVAITSVTLGKLNRSYHTTTSAGNDTIIRTTYSAASYPVHIDLINGLIYNVDSLPLGTDVAHVLVTFYTQKSAIVALLSENSDSIKIVNSADSIDFTNERKLRVFSYNGQNYRDYKMKISAHQEAADSFKWVALPVNEEFAKYTKVKSFVSGDSIYVTAGDASVTRIFSARKGSEALAWNEVSLPASLSASAQAVGAKGNIYVLDTAASAFYCFENNMWTTVSAPELATLVGVANSHVYGISNDGKMVSTTDGGATWNDEATDEAITNLPHNDIASVETKLAIEKNITRLTVIGNRSVDDFASDTTAVVWSKMYDPYVSQAEQEPFVYQPFAKNNFNKLPRMENMSLAEYSDYIVAFGGKGVGACTKEAYNQLYLSKDHGLTWKADSRFVVPSTLEGQSVTMFTDGCYIWLVAAGSGQVWRGKLNSAAWQKNETVFQ